jgi:hypothetical protein
MPKVSNWFKIFVAFFGVRPEEAFSKPQAGSRIIKTYVTSGEGCPLPALIQS